MICRNVLSVVLFFLLIAGTPVFSDVTIRGLYHEDEAMSKPAKDEEQTQYYSDQFVKLDGESNSYLFKFESGEMINIDHGKKEYMIMDFAQMKDLFEQMKPMMGEMKVSVEQTGEAKEILGKKCMEFVLKTETKMMNMAQHYWTTEDVAIDLERFRNFFEKQLFMIGMFENAEEFTKLKGLPLQQETTVSMMGMEIKQSFTPKEIIEDKIPASVFEIPKDYKKTEFDLQKLQQQ